MLPKSFSLEIVGAGNKEDYVSLAQKLKVEDRVKFLGYFAQKEDINEWIKRVDIYIQPSLSEGIPRSAIEAMAAACPLIVSRTIGASSWIDEKWHIKPRDYKGLANKILEMGKSKEILKQQASQNFETSKMFITQVREEKMDSYYRAFLENMDKNNENKAAN